MNKSVAFLCAVLGAFLAVGAFSAADTALFEFEEIQAAEVKTNRRHQVTFMLPEERIGYFTVKGERIGEELYATNRYVAHVRDGLDREDVVFYAAKSPCLRCVFGRRPPIGGFLLRILC